MVDPRQKLDELRKANGWSQSKLARELGISETAVYNWYNEKNAMPTVWTLHDACELFGITMVDLFAETDTDEKNLTQNEIHLLEMFRKLSPALQQSVLSVVKNIADAAEKQG